MDMTENDLVRMNQVVRHRLRNMASGVKSAISFLSKELDDRLTSDEKEYFPLILNECDSISDLTTRFNLLFDEVPPGTGATLAFILERVMVEVRQKFPTGQIDMLNMQSILNEEIVLDQCLFMAIKEILVNGLEVSRDRPVVLSGNLQEDWLKIEISDTGPGVEEALLSDIFLPFYTTRSRHIGIGLSIARRCVLQLGGTVEAELSQGGGLVVCLMIPLKSP